MESKRSLPHHVPVPRLPKWVDSVEKVCSERRLGESNCNPRNERIKRIYSDYLSHADGKSQATIRQIEKAISRFETHTGYMDFNTFDQIQAKSFKEESAKQRLAEATMLSTVTALKRFFGWLACQKEYKSKIVMTDIDYLSLSDRDVRAAQAPAEKIFPTLAQIETVLAHMPFDTLVENRNRAVIAFLTITGVRDGTLISLRLPVRRQSLFGSISRI